MSEVANPNCYVASLYGFAESTKGWYYQRLLPMLSQHVTVIDPWDVDVSHIFEAPVEQRPGLWTKLGLHHLETIKTQAKLVVAGLDQEPPDNGTVVEASWAAAHHIPVVGYRGDLRTTGEEGMHYNLMIAAAIRVSGGLAVATMAELSEAVEYFAGWVSGE